MVADWPTSELLLIQNARSWVLFHEKGIIQLMGLEIENLRLGSPGGVVSGVGFLPHHSMTNSSALETQARSHMETGNRGGLCEPCEPQPRAEPPVSCTPCSRLGFRCKFHHSHIATPGSCFQCMMVQGTHWDQAKPQHQAGLGKPGQARKDPLSDTLALYNNTLEPALWCSGLGCCLESWCESWLLSF